MIDRPWFSTEGVLGKTFSTKKALTEAMRAIINPRNEGDLLTGADDAFVAAVLMHHPEWAEKSSSGIRAIQARINRGVHFTNKGLWLLRNDGQEVDISWPVAISGQHLPYRKLVRDAARHAVHDQIEMARAMQYGRRCPLCNAKLLQHLHVDHAPPLTFETLITDCLASRAAEPALVDTGLHPVFADQVDAADWSAYHRLFADLRLIPAGENLSMKRVAQ
jgi:hypothetical protein